MKLHDTLLNGASELLTFIKCCAAFFLKQSYHVKRNIAPELALQIVGVRYKLFFNLVTHCITFFKI